MTHAATTRNHVPGPSRLCAAGTATSTCFLAILRVLISSMPPPCAVRSARFFLFPPFFLFAVCPHWLVVMVLFGLKGIACDPMVCPRPDPPSPPLPSPVVVLFFYICMTCPATTGVVVISPFWPNPVFPFPFPFLSFSALLSSGHSRRRPLQPGDAAVRERFDNVSTILLRSCSLLPRTPTPCEPRALGCCFWVVLGGDDVGPMADKSILTYSGKIHCRQLCN